MASKDHLCTLYAYFVPQTIWGVFHVYLIRWTTQWKRIKYQGYSVYWLYVAFLLCITENDILSGHQLLHLFGGPLHSEHVWRWRGIPILKREFNMIDMTNMKVTTEAWNLGVSYFHNPFPVSIQCPFGKNIGACLVYHLQSHNLPVVKGVTDALFYSTNQ